MQLSSFWSDYVQAIVNFVNAYPVLGPITCIALAIASGYLAYRTFTAPKPVKRKVLDINARIQNPSTFAKIVVFVVTNTIMFPVLVIKYSLIVLVELLTYLSRPIIEVIVYFQVKFENK